MFLDNDTSLDALEGNFLLTCAQENTLVRAVGYEEEDENAAKKGGLGASALGWTSCVEGLTDDSTT
jgi:hypothetical protein